MMVIPDRHAALRRYGINAGDVLSHDDWMKQAAGDPPTSRGWTCNSCYTLLWYAPPRRREKRKPVTTKFDGAVVLIDKKENVYRVLCKTYWPQRGATCDTGSVAIASWESAAGDITVRVVSRDGEDRIDPIVLSTRVAEVGLSPNGRFLGIRTMRGSLKMPDGNSVFIWDIDAGRLLTTVRKPPLLEINDYCYVKGMWIDDDGARFGFNGAIAGREGSMTYDRTGNIVTDTRFEGADVHRMWKYYVEHYSRPMNVPVETLEYLDARLTEWRQGSMWEAGTDADRSGLTLSWDLIRSDIKWLRAYQHRRPLLESFEPPAPMDYQPPCMGALQWQ